MTSEHESETQERSRIAGFIKKKDCLPTFEEFLHIPNAIVKTIGYEFMETAKSSWVRTLMKCIFFVMLATHMYCNYYLFRQLLFRFTIQENLMDIIRLCCCAFYAINSNIKFTSFVLHRSLLQHVLKTLKRTYPESIESRKRHQVNKFVLSKGERYIINFYFVASYSIVVAPLAMTIFFYAVEGSKHYLQQYAVEYDYEINNWWRYAVTYILETIHSHYMVVTNIGTDLWLIGFTAQLCMHLNYMAEELRQYNPTEENSKENYEFLVELVRRHRIILNLHEDLNEIFGFALVFVLISTTGVFCIVAVRLIIEGLSVEFIIFCSFLITAIAEFYLVCSYGQRLITTSESIALAAYEQTWYNASMEYKKLLKLIMLRSQKEAQLKAIGLKPISLDTFMIFTNYAYRVFAVIQTMLNRKFSA